MDSIRQYILDARKEDLYYKDIQRNGHERGKFKMARLRTKAVNPDYKPFLKKIRDRIMKRKWRHN
jgi:hypothetical protein